MGPTRAPSSALIISVGLRKRGEGCGESGQAWRGAQGLGRASGGTPCTGGRWARWAPVCALAATKPHPLPQPPRTLQQGNGWLTGGAGRPARLLACPGRAGAAGAATVSAPSPAPCPNHPQTEGADALLVAACRYSLTPAVECVEQARGGAAAARLPLNAPSRPAVARLAPAPTALPLTPRPLAAPLAPPRGPGSPALGELRVCSAVTRGSGRQGRCAVVASPLLAGLNLRPFGLRI